MLRDGYVFLPSSIRIAHFRGTGVLSDLIPGREILREPGDIGFTTTKGNNTIRANEVDCAVFMDSVRLMRISLQRPR